MEKKILVAAISLACSCFNEPPDISEGTEGSSESSTSSDASMVSSSLSGSATTTPPPSTSVMSSSTSDSSEESSESGTSDIPIGDYALQFDGEQNGITPSLPGLPEEYTIEFEVHTEGDLRGVMLSTASNPPARGWFFYQDEGSWTLFENVLVFIDYNAPEWNYLVDPDTDLNTENGWYHVAVTKDATGLLKLYLDGTEIAQRQFETPFLYVENKLRIGEHIDGGGVLSGAMLDNLRISSTVRYGEDFEPSSDFEPDDATLYLWRFDEGSGMTARDEVGNVEFELSNPMWTQR